MRLHMAHLELPMKAGISTLLAMLMTFVLMFIYWVHTPHRLWMRWKHT